MKFTKSFRGVKKGDIYPTEFNVGDECPEELLEAADALGALAEEDQTLTPVDPAFTTVSPEPEPEPEPEVSKTNSNKGKGKK